MLKYSLPGAEPWGMKFTPKLTQDEAKAIDGIPLDKSSIVCAERKFRYTWNYKNKHRMAKRHPWEMDRGGTPEWLDDETWAAIVKQSTITWKLMGDGLSELIVAGVVKVWARSGTSNARFTPIPGASWVHFTVEDWANGRAKGQGSDYLFDVHIETADLVIDPNAK